MYILVAMYSLRYTCISTTPHVWSWYPSHKLLHFPNPGIQFQTLYKLTLYCTQAPHWPCHGDGIIISTQSDSQPKPRRGSPGKDVLGLGFQLEILHGNFKKTKNKKKHLWDFKGNKMKKDWKPEPKPNKKRGLKKLCDEVGCCKVFIMTCLERARLTNAVILYSKCEAIKIFIVCYHMP